jgi:hypothetical protein
MFTREIPTPTPRARPKLALAKLQQAQTALLEEQQRLVQQQAEQNKVLLPFFARQEGFDVQVDPQTGQITGITELPSPERAREAEIRGLLQERSLAALKGELPVDPALERSLKEQEQELRDRLIQQFGPGYETTTPGIQTLGEFFRSAEELRSGARTGQLTLAEQLGLTREQQEMYRRGTAQDVARQFGVADPMSFAGALGQVGTGYGQAMGSYLTQIQMAQQAQQAKRTQTAGLIGAGLGALGYAAGGALGGPIGASLLGKTGQGIGEWATTTTRG